MDLDHPAVLLGLGALLGFFSSLGGQALNRHWSRDDRREDREHAEAVARRAAVDRRSDAAAVEAVDELQHVQELYAGGHVRGVYPDHTITAEHLRKLATCVLLIRGPARATLEEMISMLGQVGGIETFSGDYPSQIARVLCIQGRDALGAVLRSEPLPPEHANVQRYRAALDDWRSVMEDEERARKSNG